MEMAVKPIINDAVKPISWLLGRWVAESGKGQYPTIPSFTYCEQIDFTSVGQPLINYTARSWHPQKKNPMHLEAGFLRIKPGSNQLAFMVSHNFGLTTLEEGEVNGTKLCLKSSSISRMAFAKDPAVTKVERVFSLVNDDLQQILYMETTNTKLAEHLRIVYKKDTSI